MNAWTGPAMTISTPANRAKPTAQLLAVSRSPAPSEVDTVSCVIPGSCLSGRD